MFTGLHFKPLLLATATIASVLTLSIFAFSARAQNPDTGDAPRNLRLESTASGMLLSWDAPAQDAESVSGYRIMRRDPDFRRNLRVLVNDTGDTETTYTDTTVANGRRYIYRVHALRGDEVSGESDAARKRYSRPVAATPTPTPTNTPMPVPTATATSTPTATPTATPTPGRFPRSVPPPTKEKVGDEPDEPPVAARQSGASGRILVDNTGAADSFYSHQSSEVSAQGFTTGAASYTLTGIELPIYFFLSTQTMSFDISEATSAGQPGESIYELSYSFPLTAGTVTLFLAAPEGATLKPNTEYFLHIDGGFVLIHQTTSKAEDATGLTGWSIADNRWSYDGTTWTSSDSNVYEITVRGEVKVEPDRAGQSESTAVQLDYSRHTGESPFAKEYLNAGSDVDWFKTAFFLDNGARYRIDIDPVSLTNDDDLQVSAFYIDYPNDHSRDEFLELEMLTDPPEGLISYHFNPSRPHGPYIKVWANNDTIGEYRIRVVSDPVRTWEGSEVLKADLPHDDTTWATVTIGTSQTGVYHYYDDHDWFAVELEEDETYVIATTPPDSWLTTPDVGTALRLYDSDGDLLDIHYANSRLSSARIAYAVPTGEGGTYYVDVSYANFMDDPDALDALGLTEGFETGGSPFIGSRYGLLVSLQN